MLKPQVLTSEGVDLLPGELTDRRSAVVTSPRVLKFDRFDVGLILFVLLSYAIIHFMPFAPKQFGDGVFHEEAKAIAQAVHGKHNWSDVYITRAPGPVLYYAIPYSLLPADSTDQSYWKVGLLWTIVLMCLSVLLIRRAAAQTGDELSGKLAAGIVLLTPFSVYYSYGVYAEQLAYLGVSLACYGWAKWRLSSSNIRSPRVDRNVILMCLGLLFLILARPNAILILGIGILAALVMLSKAQTRGQAKVALLAVVITGAVSVSCLLLANRLSGGGQGKNLTQVMFHGRFQYRTEPWDWRYWDNETRAGSADYELFKREDTILKARSDAENVSPLKLKKEWLYKDALDNPILVLKQAAIRSLTLNLFVVNSKPPEAFRLSVIPGKVIYLLFHVAVNSVYLLILLASAYFLFSQRRRIASYWTLWSTYVALLIFAALTYSEPRYLVPSLPGLAVMAGISLAPIVRKLAVFPRVKAVLESRLSPA